jgi:hypothetical protein
MYYRDHAPPHFHAIYGSDEVEFALSTGRILAGKLPPRAMKLVRQWASLHEAEILEQWDRARHGEPLRPIQPLD